MGTRVVVGTDNKLAQLTVVYNVFQEIQRFSTQ